MFALICPDGKARWFPYHNRGDAECDRDVANAVGCDTFYPLDPSCDRSCPGGAHVIAEVAIGEDAISELVESVKR